VITKAINMLAASVTPIVLTVIGLFIGRSKFKKLNDWIPAFFFSVSTLLILPTIFYFGVQWAGYDPSYFSASIIEAAMPLAITPFALADIYKLNKGFIARSIVLSTIFSILTIPFWTSMVF
jgi:predicted permease